MDIYQHRGIFEKNSSTSEYYSIIENARLQLRKRRKRSDPLFTYYESHHVLPKSIFPEYKKEKWNKVLLTPEEHLRCHKLLVEMTDGSHYHKMTCAYWKMVTSTNKNMQRVVVTPEEYARAREMFSAAMSIISQRPCSEATKKLISIANDGKKPSKEAVQNSVKARKGKKRPEYAVRASAEAQKGNTNTLGKFWWNNGVKQKVSFESPGEGWVRGRLEMSGETKKIIGLRGTGRVQSSEEKEKRRRAMTGYKWPEEFGKNVSKAKKGKKTNQQEIMGKKYASMDDDTFYQYRDKMKSLLAKNRATNLRNKWLLIISTNNDK